MGDSSSSFWFDCWTCQGPLCNSIDYVHILDSYLQIHDCWNEGCWNFNILCTAIFLLLKNLVLEVPIPWNHDSEDYWVWVVGSSGVYSVASYYRWLISQAKNENSILSWKWIWHLKALFKISFLVWLAVHDSLPTNVLHA